MADTTVRIRFDAKDNASAPFAALASRMNDGGKAMQSVVAQLDGSLGALAGKINGTARSLQALGATQIASSGGSIALEAANAMKIRSVFGSFSVTVVSGYSEQDGKTLTPLRERLFGGARGILTPLLERNIAHLGLECGSFEKAARLCADWGGGRQRRQGDGHGALGRRALRGRRPAGDLRRRGGAGRRARAHGGRLERAAPGAPVGEEGAPREERVYFFSDGGVYLWNIWEIREKGGPKTEMRPK